MNDIPGSRGYNSSIEQFVRATNAVSFEELHEPFLELIPTSPCQILDVGAGVGRDASVLAGMGHEVFAVEPLLEFRIAGMTLHSASSIHWLDDSLPELATLGNNNEQFGFVLASAVWHHLNAAERGVAVSRLFSLLKPGGILALSLRNGPAGAGSHVFPTDPQCTISVAEKVGFEMIASVLNLPSLIAGKVDVTWSKLAFKRT